MTRQDFEDLAIAIGGIDSDFERFRMADLVGEVCSRHNTLFNWIKWNKACNTQTLVNTQKSILGYFA